MAVAVGGDAQNLHGEVDRGRHGEVGPLVLESERMPPDRLAVAVDGEGQGRTIGLVLGVGCRDGPGRDQQNGGNGAVHVIPFWDHTP
jgi:hypothetical protein